jgi:hypothetical protein
MKKLSLLIIVVLSINNINAQWVTNGPYGANSGFINCLAINGSNIFAGSDSGVFLSTNNGGNWIAVNNGLTNIDITSLAVSGSNIFAGTAGEGVFISTNNGANWKAVNNGLTSDTVNALVINGKNIFAGTNKGVFLSSDSGSNWTGINNGLLNTTVLSLALNNSTIFAGTQGGVWQQSLASLTGIQKVPALAQNTFSLFPNPANNNFVIETNTTGKQLLQVFDITGKLVLTQNITNSKTTIDASNLSNGIYSARLLSNDGLANTKLVIVR